MAVAGKRMQIERLLAARPDVALIPIDPSRHCEQSEAIQGDVSDAALDRHGGQGRLAMTDSALNIPPECVTPAGMLRTLPFHAGGMDGFFAARLTVRTG